MPFDEAYEYLTSLMVEKYDFEVKEALGLSGLFDDVVQAYAGDYFDGFHGLLSFLAAGIQRDTTPLIFYINRLHRIAQELFSNNWDVHTALITYLLEVEVQFSISSKKKDSITETKSRFRCILEKLNQVDLDHCDTEGLETTSIVDWIPDWDSKKVSGRKISLRPFIPRIYWKFVFDL